MTDLTPLEQLRVAMQDIEDARRTVLCPPDLKDHVEAAIEQLGLSGAWTVQVSRFTAGGKIFVLDPNAIEANFRQAGLRALRDPRVDPEPPIQAEEWRP